MDLKELYAEYERADNIVSVQKAELEKAIAERSRAVKAIAEAVSPKKKVIRNGRELTIVVRGDTYFFRGAGTKNEAVEI